MTVAAEKKALQPPDLLSQPRNDFGDAQRVMATYGGEVRYLVPQKKWLIWTGTRWLVDERDTIRTLAHAVMLEFCRQAAGNGELTKFAGASLNSNRITAAIRELQPMLPVLPPELDSNPHLLNFRNGTLDLESGELLTHRPENLITKLIDHDYDPRAKCPLYLRFVRRILGDLAPHVQKAIGYSLGGVTSEKVAFVCHGPTDSGKTTFLEFWHWLLSDYAAQIDIESLMAREEDNNSRADLCKLRGCRFATTSETRQGQRLNEAKLKRTTKGQGKISAVRKYEDWIEFPETHKLWLDCNHLPVVRDPDDSVWNRFVVFVFQRLDQGEIDRTFPDKLKQEASGAIAWAIEGYRLYRKEGLTIAPEMRLAKSEWRSDMDRLRTFVQSSCVMGTHVESGARAIYKAYSDWARDAGEHPMSEREFSERMRELGKELGFQKEPRRSGIVYVGIGLLADCGAEKS